MHGMQQHCILQLPRVNSKVSSCAPVLQPCMLRLRARAWLFNTGMQPAPG